MDSTKTVTIHLADNLADALLIQNATGGADYIMIDTTTGAKVIALGNATDNPVMNFLGTGQKTFSGNVDATAGLDVTTAALTAAAGFTVSGGTIDLDPTETFDLSMDATKTATIHISDNLDASFLIQEAANNYFEIDTRDGAEIMNFGNATTNPDYSFLGTGQVTFAGNVDATNGLDVTTAALTAAAGFTVSGGVTTITGSDIDLDPTGHFTLDMDATKKITFTVADNLADTFKIQEGANSIMAITSANGAEAIDFGYNVDANLGLDVSGGNLTLDSNDFIINSNKFRVDGATGDTLVAGNLVVQGNITGIQTLDMIMRDNYMQENVGYTTAVGMTGGLVTNYLPTATASTSDGAFVPGTTALALTGTVDGTATQNTLTGTGTQFLTELKAGWTIVIDPGGTPETKVIASIESDTGLTLTTVLANTHDDVSVNRSATNAYVTITDSAVFALSDIIQISGSTDGTNDGFFEVLSNTATKLVVRGIGVTATVEAFSRNQFEAMAAPAPDATITKVTVSVIRAGTDGAWEVGSGAATGIAYEDLVTSSLGMTLQAAYEGGNTITTDVGDGDVTFTGTEDFIVTLVDINLDPTGDFTLDMDAGQTITLTIADELANALKIQEGANTYLAISTIDGGAEEVRISNSNLMFDGLGIDLEPTLKFHLDMTNSSNAQIEILLKDNQSNSVEIFDSFTTYLRIDTTTGAEEIVLGDNDVSTFEIFVDAPMHFGNATRDTKGNLYQDNYGTHIVCLCPSGSTATVAQGVAFLTSGTFEVSGAAGAVDQSTVPKTVRGVAQATSAGNTYIKVQISGIAEVEALAGESYDEGTLVKWNKAGKVCPDTKDLGTAYWEELAGVIVAMANRAGAAYQSGVQNRLQILMMNPAAESYIPA
jgi:hypothetical protein